MAVGNDYYMVKFDFPEDKTKVMEGGPWMINGKYLAVKRWSPSFNPCESCFGRTLIWIRLSALNLMYYEESSVTAIAQAIGTPVRVDLTTQTLERGRYARVCVEIDLSRPVARQMWINDHWHEIEYENLHLICSLCKRFGHVTRDCA